MKSKNIFQYVSSIIEIELLNRVIHRALNSANIILDLEDSIQNVTDNSKNSELKEQARKNLSQLSNTFYNSKVGIRINQINSIEYRKDIELLKELKQIKWNFIVLPKVESYVEIQQFIKDIATIEFNEIILCIESENGMNNLHSILRKIKHKKITRIQFGHFDYFLDKGVFPIPEQTSPVFWETCELLIQEVERLGYTYLHTPMNELNSEALANGIVKRLKLICKNEFGFATVSSSQNKLLLNFENSEAHSLSIGTNSTINKVDFAQEIIKKFSNSNTNFSFEHKNTHRIFIPPQEYYGAIKFLSKI